MAKKSDSFYFGNFYACADCAYQAAHLWSGSCGISIPC